ncbi:MAG: DUF3124 domain-containing protein [Chloroflexota bacterium]
MFRTPLVRTGAVVVAAVLTCLVGVVHAQPALVKGQTVYVPAYSNILFGDKPQPFNLATTLVIHNINTKDTMNVISADYHDSHGKLVKKLLPSPIKLQPMASTHFFIQESDTSGGLGANFLVKWQADKKVNAPIIEAVMIGTKFGQGISFVSHGREIVE